VGTDEIIKLRNTWDKLEWKGDYSDDSKLWTKELSAKLGHTKAEDGIFFMPISDFKKCFLSFTVAVKMEGG